MSHDSPAPLRLWDDNPTFFDLLGFDAVVEPILEALRTPDLDPLTIGVQSPWGGGKSTVLNLLDSRLFNNPRYVVVRTDPWEYDNQADVSGALIAEILDGLQQRFAEEAQVTEKAKELLDRISWSRIGLALGRGMLTMQWDPETALEAFRPRERSSPESMGGFREAFGELIDALPDVERVVILVDDVDRCLPDAVMATLEAIKLFLSVRKMVFVLAADQDMVRDAIAASLDATNRSERFASRYLEKIVQLPISLPRLAPQDAEAYIGLLLANRVAPSEGAFIPLVEHCAERRNSGRSPLLGDLSALVWSPPEDLLRLAGQLAQGLSADKLANPRQVKRFLNAFGVRATVADARGVTIPPPVLVKMLLLEDQHRTSFETLAATSSAERRTLLEAWEAWAHGDTQEPPQGVGPETKGWAAAQPSLATVNLDQYLTLAASLLNVSVGSQVSDQVSDLVGMLLSESDAARSAALQQLTVLGESDQREGVELLLASARRLDDLDPLFASAIEWAKRNPTLAERIVTGIRENWTRLTTGAVVELASSGLPPLVALVRDASTDDTLNAMVREAARVELGT